MTLLLAEIDIGALIPLAIIVIGVIYNLVRKAVGGEEEAARDRARQKREELQAKQAQAGAAPAKKEPMLPYEELIDQMFGPYIEKRKEAHAARHGEQEEDEDEPVIRIIEETPAPAPSRRAATPAPAQPVMRILEEMPPKVAIPGAIGESEQWVAPGGRRRSLDEILFRNRRLSSGAKLVLAAEILNRPKPGRFPRVP